MLCHRAGFQPSGTAWIAAGRDSCRAGRDRRYPAPCRRSSRPRPVGPVDPGLCQCCSLGRQSARSPGDAPSPEGDRAAVRATARTALGRAGDRPGHYPVVGGAVALARSWWCRTLPMPPGASCCTAWPRSFRTGAIRVMAERSGKCDMVLTRGVRALGPIHPDGGSVAQLVEQATFNREVPGSSPGGPTRGVSGRRRVSHALADPRK